MNKLLRSFITISATLTVYNIFGMHINNGIIYIVESLNYLNDFIPSEVVGLFIFILLLFIFKYISQWK